MKKIFTANKALSIALSLIGLALIGTAPASAQSRDRTGSSMPYYYDAAGGQVWGSWTPEAPAAVPPRVAPSARPLYLYAPHSLKHR